MNRASVNLEGVRETHEDKGTGLPKQYEEDIDGDGDLDLVFAFPFGDATLTCGSTEVTLFGEQFDKVAIRRTDRARK